jgi:type VI secretion system secreted protein Hcp
MSHADYFLKIDGIEGESKDHKHKGEIELLSWSYYETGRGTPGVAMTFGISFTAAISKATPKLAQACSNGVHFPKVVLTARKSGGQQQEFLKWVLTNAFVCSHQTAGTKVSKLSAIEKASLQCERIEQEYREQKQDGTLAGAVKAGWNAKQNAPV